VWSKDYKMLPLYHLPEPSKDFGKEQTQKGSGSQGTHAINEPRALQEDPVTPRERNTGGKIIGILGDKTRRKGPIWGERGKERKNTNIPKNVQSRNCEVAWAKKGAKKTFTTAWGSQRKGENSRCGPWRSKTPP